MGLDIYLFTKQKSADDNDWVETIYWRKVNAIHRWFVDNVQSGVDECHPSPVTLDRLRLLLDTVNRVLEDHSLAEELLPPQSGFFFGSTDINEHYFDCLEYTKEELTRFLERPDLDDLDILYQSSW